MSDNKAIATKSNTERKRDKDVIVYGGRDTNRGVGTIAYCTSQPITPQATRISGRLNMLCSVELIDLLRRDLAFWSTE